MVRNKYFVFMYILGGKLYGVRIIGYNEWLRDMLNGLNLLVYNSR